MPVIRISDYVMNILKKYAIPLEDNADSVLRRILLEYDEMKEIAASKFTSIKNNKNTRKSKISGSNESFPRDYTQRYVRWIFSTLNSLGGSSDAEIIIKQIQKKFENEFTQRELETLPSGDFRWVKNVNWARYDMVKGGLLDENAPYGIWKLTEKGKNYYNNSIEKKHILKGETSMENASPRVWGKSCREALRQHLQNRFGNLYLMKSWLIQSGGKDKILALYSAKYKDDDKWFYGIIKNYLNNWDNNCYLILLMRDGINCSFVLFNPTESRDLINKLDPAKDGSKKINIRMPSTGKIYIEKWPDFPFAERIIELEVMQPPYNLTQDW